MESADFDTANQRRPSLANRPERNSIVPPYWQRHERTHSNLSVHASERTPIRLEDHTDESSEQCKALWAKHVSIDDYVVIGGTPPGIGAYVVWNCTVETLDVSLPERCSSLAQPAARLTCSSLTALGWSHEDYQKVASAKPSIFSFLFLTQNTDIRNLNTCGIILSRRSLMPPDRCHHYRPNLSSVSHLQHLTPLARCKPTHPCPVLISSNSKVPNQVSGKAEGWPYLLPQVRSQSCVHHDTNNIG